MQLASGPHSVWRYDGCGTGDWRPLSIDVRPFVVGSKVLDSKKFVWALIYQSDAHMGGLGWGVGLVVKIGFKFKCLNAAGATNQQWESPAACDRGCRVAGQASTRPCLTFAGRSLQVRSSGEAYGQHMARQRRTS
ncbi:hypothetical protein PAHAL_3G106900 [Panicum hallii]|uniref:Uncharacterized protein n=1 Tax=Panicum hallii TaxID=206008 RepID=A0A2S3H7Q8_9POAL|nr:hypothetical protein PAHAL_3G106900 [Panicum hallii]